MPNLIVFGVINSNTPQQNAGVFVGEFNSSGWDANAKQNYGHGSVYGLFNTFIGQWNLNIDSFESVDGMIIDQDFKPLLGGNM